MPWTPQQGPCRFGPSFSCRGWGCLECQPGPKRGFCGRFPCSRLSRPPHGHRSGRRSLVGSGATAFTGALAAAWPHASSRAAEPREAPRAAARRLRRGGGSTGSDVDQAVARGGSRDGHGGGRGDGRGDRGVACAGRSWASGSRGGQQRVRLPPRRQDWPEAPANGQHTRGFGPCQSGRVSRGLKSDAPRCPYTRRGERDGGRGR